MNLSPIVLLFVSIFSVWCVFFSWKNVNKKLLASAGWLLFLFSIFLWIKILGVEFGFTYSIVVFACIVWLVIAIVTLTSETNKVAIRTIRPKPYLNKISIDPKSFFPKHALLFVLSVPFAGAASILLSLAIVSCFSWTTLNKVCTAIFVMPIIWGGLSAWICANTKPWFSSSVIAGLLSISSIVLFWV